MTTTTQTIGSKAAADVAALLRARNPLIWIVTKEEQRTERLLMESAQIAQYEPRFQDCSQGITDYAGKQLDASCVDPAEVLKQISNSTKRQVWILRDFDAFLRDPFVLRGLRSLARNLTLAPRDEARAVIILTPSSEIPPQLAGHAISIDWPLPDRAEIAAILDSAIDALPEEIKATAAPNGTRDAAIDAAVGLTAEEAQACYAKSLVSTRKIDPATVAAEKKRVISKEKVLEWIDPIPGGLNAVGGLENLKTWLKERRAAFGPKARAYGLPTPKGMLLVGQPGCGKSLTAKAVAAAWGMPLLRLDMGALKSKWVGDSEANIRKALKVAVTVSPCILWIDEIDKTSAGQAGSAAADGGTSTDQVGALLTWQQEQQGVFVVATANSVEGMPPAMLRKGRFDEIFFVDLPTHTERADILRAALAQYGRNAGNIDVNACAERTDGFTGSEIAAMIPEAMYSAFADGEREIISPDIFKAAANTVPLSKTASDSIDKLRQWAKGRARNASATTTTTSTGTARKLDI